MVSPPHGVSAGVLAVALAHLPLREISPKLKCI